MSVPHTGHLEASIRGAVFVFDGDVWSGPDETVLCLLADTTAKTPTTHRSILDLAEKILRDCGLEGEILAWEADSWRDELPPGAID
jgi:hypothetical protein